MSLLPDIIALWDGFQFILSFGTEYCGNICWIVGFNEGEQMSLGNFCVCATYLDGKTMNGK